NKPPGDPSKPTIVLDPGMHTGRIWNVFFREQGKQLVTVGDDHTVRLWDISDKEMRQIEVLNPPGYGAMYSAEISRDGNLLAFSTAYAAKGPTSWVIYVLSLPERRIVRTLRMPYAAGWPVMRLAFSADGKRFAANAWDKPIHVWDLSKPSDTPPEI